MDDKIPNENLNNPEDDFPDIAPSLENSEDYPDLNSVAPSLDGFEEFDTDQLKDFFSYADTDYAEDSYVSDFSEEVSETLKEGEEKEKKERKPLFGPMFKTLGARFEDSRKRRQIDRQLEEADSDIKLPRNMEKEARRYARPLAGIYQRSNIGFVIALVMLWLSVSFEIRGRAPIVGDNGLLLTAVMMFMLIAVMFVCFDLTSSGFYSVLRGKFTAEALIAVSCAVTIVDGIVILLSHSYDNGVPLCVISAFSLAFGMRGNAYYNMAMRDSLRVLNGKNKTKFGVHIDSESVEDRSVLRKYPDALEGFYQNLLRRDLCEQVYSYAAPIMALAALVFAFLSTVVRGRPAGFFHAFAGLMAVTASFSCLSAFSLPFKNVAEISRRTGGAVAGWTGADKLADADGVFVTDNDLYPLGTQSILGMEINDNVGRQKVVEYAGSLAVASGCDLENPFSELMKAEGIEPSGVEDFVCYETGGIGGVVRSENVLMGTYEFMDMMSVTIPEEYAHYKRATFLAVNRRFAAIFGINNYQSPKVQKCMVNIRRAGLKIIFAIKDFNLTPKVLSRRFKLSLRGLEFIPIADSYRLAGDTEPTGKDAVAIVGKDSFLASARLVSRAAKLKQTALLSTIVSVIGSAAGLVLLFLMCWNGPVRSLTAWGIGVYMLAMHLVTVVLAAIAKRS